MVPISRAHLAACSLLADICSRSAKPAAEASNSVEPSPSSVAASDTTSIRPPPPVAACMKLCTSRKQPGSTKQTTVTCTRG